MVILAVKQVVEQGFLGDIIEIESHIDYFRPGSITHEAPKRRRFILQFRYSYDGPHDFTIRPSRYGDIRYSQ